MIINGIEREFVLTVGAFAEISDMCDGKRFDLEGLYRDKSSRDSIEIDKRLAIILNQAALDRKKAEHPGVDQPPALTMDDFDSAMPLPKFIALQNEISQSIKAGLTPEVEAETEGKNA